MAHPNLTLFDLPKTNDEVNKIDPLDLPIHDWYRFVLSTASGKRISEKIWIE